MILVVELGFGPRLVKRAHGYWETLESGVEVLYCEDTGQLPFDVATAWCDANTLTGQEYFQILVSPDFSHA